MNPTLKEIYSLAFYQWPYVAAAYALLWVGLLAYVGMAWRRVSKVEAEVKVLEESMARRGTPVAE